MSFAAVLSLLLALARAVPALDRLFGAVARERAAEREREAQARKIVKDSAVDAAIDGPKP